MKYDYHMHTKYCKHSNIVIDKLVSHYVGQEFKEMGISDHIPYKGALDSKDNSRMHYSELPDYLRDIKDARNKYKGKIKIWTGFESEYFPAELEWYKEILRMEEVDYLILGIHAVENLDPENNYNKGCTTPFELNRYWVALEEGMRTGLYAYAVHPDFFMKSYENWDEHTEELAHKIIDLALELNFPIGFNINGLWKGPRKIGNAFRNKYPVEQFWKIVKDKGVKILLESDVHMYDQLYDTEIIDKTYEQLEEWGVKHLVVEKIDIQKYKEKLKNIL